MLRWIHNQQTVLFRWGIDLPDFARCACSFENFDDSLDAASLLKDPERCGRIDQNA
jgi:hypothetical protein